MTLEEIVEKLKQRPVDADYVNDEQAEYIKNILGARCRTADYFGYSCEWYIPTNNLPNL